MSSQLLWADGGESAHAPADTMPAYWGALGAGADGLALTVQATRDGVLVCASGDSLKETTGVDTRMDVLTSQELRKLDAGAAFRSLALDTGNRVTGSRGLDVPWRQHDHQPDGLFHPELDEVLLHLARRTRFLLTIQPARDAAPSDIQKIAADVIALVKRHAIRGRTTLAGSAAVVAVIGQTHASVCLVPDPAASLADAVSQAKQANISLVLARVRTLAEADALTPADVSVIVQTARDQPALDPELYAALSPKPWVAGYAVTAVDAMHAVMHARGLVVRDGFDGPRADPRLWALGRSRNNDDTTITVSDGLGIVLEGEHYSGAAAFSVFSIRGDFDARISFEVENPQQGTTFELAALHVDAGYRPINLTFDVHGAPPYASSERDENDGFRIGWNNGPALTRWVDNEPQSSNLYNCYGRDVGYARQDSGTGRLRLTRCGAVFNAYYTDKLNEGWVLSGSVEVPALASAVFLRLGAKHWPKKGNAAPPNRFRFFDFELYQWD
jgi:hypothetical protein